MGCPAAGSPCCGLGVLPGEHGVENGVLGLPDRGVGEVDGPGGVVLRILRVGLGLLSVALSLPLVGPLANLGEVFLPRALNAFAPRPRLLGGRSRLAASEVRYLLRAGAGLRDRLLEVLPRLRLGGRGAVLRFLGPGRQS